MVFSSIVVPSGIMDGGEKNNKIVGSLHLAKLFAHKPTQRNDPEWPPIK
jgi:hypothetical protein